jgi:hypothetical protein
VAPFGSLPMVPFTYRCPRTGQQVQGWAADDLTEGETYDPGNVYRLRADSSHQLQVRQGAGGR